VSQPHLSHWNPEIIKKLTLDLRPANLADGLLTPIRLPRNPDDLLFRIPFFFLNLQKSEIFSLKNGPEKGASPGFGDFYISAGLVFGEQATPTWPVCS
jgi:hypothetical protein